MPAYYVREDEMRELTRFRWKWPVICGLLGSAPGVFGLVYYWITGQHL